jgi:poly(glycerol-phosphate) alpha-glucosyltransferase
MLDSWAVRNSGWKKKIACVLFECATLRRAACLRALCRAEAEAIRSFGCRNPICIIPNGADMPDETFCDPAWKQRVCAEANILLYLGRLHPKKGILQLLEAWAGLAEEGAAPDHNWVLAIAGWDDGGHEAILKQRAEELRLKWADAREQTAPTHPGGVLFTGPQFGADKSASYHRADAFILPSLSEGLPMTVLEAWSHGKPVLMTTHCNLPEGFESGAAIRIGTESHEILTGLKRLVRTSSGERRETGAQGVRLVAEKFCWKRVSDQLMAVSEWTLSGGTRPDSVWEH